jgi:hypothetical protein
MSTALYELTYNSKNIPVRKDGFLDVTFLCSMVGKKFTHWYNLISTPYIIKEIEDSISCPALELGKNQYRHSWAHPLLAIEVARWADPRISILINRYYMRVKQGDEALITEIQDNKLKYGEYQEEINNLKTQVDEIYDKDYYEKHMVLEGHYNLTGVQLSNRDVFEMYDHIMHPLTEEDTNQYIPLDDVFKKLNIHSDNIKDIENCISCVYPISKFKRHFTYRHNKYMFVYIPSDALDKYLKQLIH